MQKRKLQVRISYEINRSADTYLLDAYEKLSPIIKQQIKTDKKIKNTEEKNVSRKSNGDFK
jgi:hypothetical protein